MWPFRQPKYDQRSNPANQMPVDWDAFFEGRASWGVLVAANKELHLRLLRLEGNNAEADRLTELHERKLNRTE